MKIIGAFAPERQPSESGVEVVRLRDVRAELLTLGGAIVFAVCMLLTVFAVSINRFVSITQTQHVILIALVGLCWIYFFDSITERLRLVDQCVEFRSLFSRHHVVPLAQLEAMLLVYQGFNLERGMETIEFRKHDAKTQTVSLGPCWQRYKLEAFVHAVEEALQEPLS
ncbi:hypothetical protein KBC54_02160 [Patescibacteria group bacterium]|nr:hypothetical protein [Patescibacteria group bacterium]